MALKQRLQFKARLLYNQREKGSFFRLSFSAPLIARSCLPGQFFTLRLSEGSEPLLRRPFSIHRVEGPKVEILYEVVGRATQILSEKRRGEYLDIIGPLGNGFDLSSLLHRPSSLVLVAGGMGVAPLTFLAEKLREIQNPKSKIQNLVLLGAKNKNQILCEKEFRKLGCQVRVATDDGSRGFKGKVTGLLIDMLRGTRDEGRGTIYACGPRPMLKEISRICHRRNLAAQLSLEEHMACGIGACLGCVVNTKDGYRTACKDGPVFEAERIIWEGK